MFTQKEKTIVQELVKQYAELASLEVNRQRMERGRNINDLKTERPMVWIDEIPWHEMDIGNQLTLQCENELARSWEWHLRTILFRWKYFQGDMVVEDAFYVYKTIHSTGNGLPVAEHTIATDNTNHIISHQYIDQLDTMEKVARIKNPVVTGDAQRDAQNLALAKELLGETLPVKMRGHGTYVAPWDVISRYRGAEAILMGMAVEPDLLHATIKRFAEVAEAELDQMEEHGLLDYNIPTLHCTPPYTSDLPAKDYDGGKVRLKDIWYRGMAQLFSSVSPDMHQEFELDYVRKMMDKCGLVYYGCCEPLDNKLDILRKIPNLRKLGVSPWANVEKCAEQMGGDYVFARKPNPALVAGTIDKEAIAKETADTIEACLKYNCPLEFVLKDISTVTYKPENLIEWNQIVQETINRYY